MSGTALTGEPPSPTTGQQLGAEVLGTFVLVFFGVGSVVIAIAAGAGSLISVASIAFAFGIAVFAMTSAVGRISGGHFNPAVSVAAALGGRVPWSGVPAYVAGQLVGAVLGSTALFAVAKGYDGFVAKGNMGANSFGDAGSGIAWWAALLLELILTLVFVLVFLGVTDARSQHPGLAPLAIGLTLTGIYLVAIPATGASVNPARSIGPALFSGSEALKQLWLFIVAPLLGGGIGGMVYPALFGHGTEPVARSGLRFGGGAKQMPGYVVPDAYQQQWNQEPGQAPWGQQQPVQQPAAPAQGWPQPGQAPYPPQQPWSAPPARQPAQPAPPPAQQPGRGWPSQPPAPGTTPGSGEEPDDGRTQIRPQQ